MTTIINLVNIHHHSCKFFSAVTRTCWAIIITPPVPISPHLPHPIWLSPDLDPLRSAKMLPGLAGQRGWTESPS